MRGWEVALGSDKGQMVSCGHGRGDYVKRGEICGHVSECQPVMKD